jgi:ABC-type methionine transport system permease subunit
VLLLLLMFCVVAVVVGLSVSLQANIVKLGIDRVKSYCETLEAQASASRDIPLGVVLTCVDGCIN